MPGLIKAVKEILTAKVDSITPTLAFKLYDTHGLDEEILSTLASAMKIKFNVEDYHNGMKEAKRRSKEASFGGPKNVLLIEELKNKIRPTEDHYKYNYKKENGRYNFPDLNVDIVAIVENGKLMQEIKPDVNCALILNKTNFYAEAGGQQGDHGVIKLKDGVFIVQQTEFLHNYVLHNGMLKSNSILKVGDCGIAKVDNSRRLNAMRNHTGVHLLNAALKKLNKATCQKSSRVTDEFLYFDVGIFGEKLSVDDCAKVENIINNAIAEKLEVVTKNVDSEILYGADDVTLIPGEVYPELNVRLIEILSRSSFASRYNPKSREIFLLKSVMLLENPVAVLMCIILKIYRNFL